MENIRRKIKELTEQQTKIKQENEEELNKREEAYEALHDYVYLSVSNIELKKKGLYYMLMREVIKNHKIDFSTIAKLKVDEITKDEYDEYTEFNTYENIPLIDFKIEKYTQFETLNSTWWADLVSTLCELSYWNSDRVTIKENKEWSDFRIIDNETKEEYPLRWSEDKTQALIEVETINVEGSCTLNIYFNLK